MASILLADEHGPTRELLAERLTADGHHVTVGSTPSEAYERFATGEFDLVVLALALPELDGRHLAARLRDEGGGRTRVVLYDAVHLGRPRGVQAILSLGANAFVPDPTDHRALRERLERLLAAAPDRRPDAARTDARAIRRGELEAGVLPRVLLMAAAAGRTGGVVLAEGNAVRTIHLLEGRPCGYSSNLRRESLGRFLVEHGAITEHSYQEALEVMARDGLSLTGALVAVGALEAGEAVYEQVLEYARAMIEATFALRDGQYRVVEDRELATAVPALELPLLPLLQEGIRRHLPTGFFQTDLGEKLDAYPYRSASFAGRLREMQLAPAELAFAMKISGEVTGRTLVADARAQMKTALRLLWFFDLLGVVAFSEDRHESADAGVYRSAAGAGRTLPPLDEGMRTSLQEEALQIVTQSYFGALGLDISAGVEEIERAYHERATRFHPETYPDRDLSEVEDLFQTVLDRVTAAYRVLSVEEKRSAYLAHLLSRYESDRRHGPIDPAAEIALRRGLNRMEDRDWRGAERAFEQAIEANPREPEYFCHLAFARYKAASGPPEARSREPRKLLKRALALDSGLDGALVLLGILELECGDRAKARRYVLDALKLNPQSAPAKAALARVNRPPSSG